MRVDEPSEFRSNLVNNLNKIIKNQKLAANVEKGIFNYTIKTCKEKKYCKKMGKQIFRPNIYR